MGAGLSQIHGAGSGSREKGKRPKSAVFTAVPAVFPFFPMRFPLLPLHAASYSGFLHAASKIQKFLIRENARERGRRSPWDFTTEK